MGIAGGLTRNPVWGLKSHTLLAPLLPTPATASYNQAYIEPQPSISFGSTFAPIHNDPPWQSCAPTNRRLRQNRSVNQSRSWPASSTNALSWRRPTTQIALSWGTVLYGAVGSSMSREKILQGLDRSIWSFVHSWRRISKCQRLAIL